MRDRGACLRQAARDFEHGFALATAQALTGDDAVERWSNRHAMNYPHVQQAIFISTAGGPEVLQLRNTAVVPPGDGEILIAPI
jgi:hypothetical protein